MTFKTGAPLPASVLDVCFPVTELVSRMAVSFAVSGLAGPLAPGCWSERLLDVALPQLRLPSSGGGLIDLHKLARQPLLVFVHPGVERRERNPRDPDGLLSSGCTVQAQGFKELALDYAARGVRVVGVSSVASIDQRQFARREQLPFPLLSDAELELVGTLGLPTYLTPDGRRLYQRLSFLADEGVIQRVFHPVPIPRRNAADIFTHMHHYQPV